MAKVKQLIRFTGISGLGCLATLVIFGLALAAYWSLPLADNTNWKLAGLIVASGLALAAGGYLVGRMERKRKILAGAVSGGLAGLFGFGYVFGPGQLFSILTGASIASLLGAGGGWLAGRFSQHN